MYNNTVICLLPHVSAELRHPESIHQYLTITKYSINTQCIAVTAAVDFTSTGPLKAWLQFNMLGTRHYSYSNACDKLPPTHNTGPRNTGSRNREARNTG